MPRRLTPREALAIAEYILCIGKGHPKPLEDWRLENAECRAHFRDRGTRLARAYRQLGFQIVPLPEKKGRKRG